MSTRIKNDGGPRRSWFQALIQAGLQENDTKSFGRKIMLCNFLILVFILIGFLYLLLFSVSGQFSLAKTVLITMLLDCFCFGLIYRRYFVLGRLLFMSFVTISVVAFGSMIGKFGGSSYFLFALVPLPFAVFEKRENIWSFLLIGLIFIGLQFLRITQYSFLSGFMPPLSEQDIFWHERITETISFLTLVGLTILYLHSPNH